MSEPLRVVSVGTSRMFRLVEMSGEQPTYQIQQAIRVAKARQVIIAGKPQKVTFKWEPRALAHGPRAWNEGHGSLHAMQAEYVDEVARRRAMKVRGHGLG